jgi:hypothetical protein
MFNFAHSRGRALSCVSVMLAGLMASTTTGAQTLVAGHTPGEFSVSPGGAANYSIPIQLPPGVAGLVPSLSLSYRSQSVRPSIFHISQ